MPDGLVLTCHRRDISRMGSLNPKLPSEKQNLQEIGLSDEIIPKAQLQIEEIDDARFMNKEEAGVRIFHRYSELLELID